MKSQKAIRLSFSGAILIALVISAMALVSIRQHSFNIHFLMVFIFGAGTFILSFFTIYYLMNRYLYQRLLSVHEKLVSYGKDKFRLNTDKKPKAFDIADEINKKLSQWEEDKKEEINQLVKLELYRKEFLGNVSHELKTPIFSVQGYVHTLLDGGIEDSDINLLYLKKAAKSIDRLINIVDDLESISKLESGDLILEKQTFDINELVKDTIESLELMANEQNITLSILPEHDKSFYINADKNSIRQVLVNLFVNSIKYGNNGGLTQITYTDTDNKVWIHISDNGIGISPDSQSRLFERFYRVDKSRSREQGGTGLGLAIVKHIVEAHGEEIGVKSEPGKGSVFTLSLSKA